MDIVNDIKRPSNDHNKLKNYLENLILNTPDPIDTLVDVLDIESSVLVYDILKELLPELVDRNVQNDISPNSIFKLASDAAELTGSQSILENTYTATVIQGSKKIIKEAIELYRKDNIDDLFDSRINLLDIVAPFLNKADRTSEDSFRKTVDAVYSLNPSLLLSYYVYYYDTIDNKSILNNIDYNISDVSDEIDSFDYYNDLDIAIKVLENIRVDSNKLAMSMSSIDSWYVMNSLVPRLDMKRLIQDYNNGKGNNISRRWFEEIVLNQI